MVPLIPLGVLFGNPDRVSPRLSPDGRTLAYIAPREGVLNLFVRTVGGADDRAVTNDRGRGIREYAWAEDSAHLLYIQDRDGDENWHLYRAPAAGGEALDLTPIPGVQARIVGLSRRHPDAVLVGLNDRDPSLHDVWRIDIGSGSRTPAVTNEIGAVGWTADHALRVRVAMVPTADGGFTVLHRMDEAAPWSKLLSFASEDALSSDVHGFADDDRTLHYASPGDADTASLRAVDTHTGDVRVLAVDPEADLAEVLAHPVTGVPQAAVFWRARRVWRVLDPAIRADVEALSAAHRGDLSVVGRDNADRRWITAHVDDRGPVVYHVWDREARAAQFLFSSRTALENQPLAEMRPVSYRARDGLTIHGYLTLPRQSGGERLPAVLNVHGGPWHRDYWGYDPEAQWLANRGYACLQVNFRGSTGYGKTFVNAGDREWGGAMQDDLTDAVEFLVDSGVADPRRVGIYGGSYGGYAVLAGLTKTPDLFACGVDIVGPSNLVTFSRSIPPYWEPLRALFVRRVGDVEKDPEFLRSRSPLFAVEKIRAPLFIAQGQNDPRVKREESLQIVEALTSAGKTVDYLEFPDEGHGFARPENRLVFYRRAEKFLAAHLGGRCE